MWSAIAVIAIACALREVFRQKYVYRSHQATEDQLEQLTQRIDKLDQDLRQRVETLERIVTDGKEDLRRQFDYLDKVS